MKLFFIIVGIFVLRIPSLFEPYWYGDEQIYLVLAQAMNRGAVLYRDIWDNKPPLLYALYAIVPTLFWAKVMAIGFVLGTCVGVYYLSKKIFKAKSTFFALSATTLTGIFLSIPLFEGTIANAELFFTLPIVWGGLIIFNLKFEIFNQSKFFNLKLIIVGLLMAVAFLFKVPAIFDFMGMLLAFLLISFERGGLSSTQRPPLVKVLPIFVAFLILLVIILGYFYINHALTDFIIASFSQNASYISVDSGPLSKLSNPLFVKAFILLFASLGLFYLFVKKLITKDLFFLSLWFGFSLYGTLLSNRSYMHYLLQVIPPFVLLFVYILVTLRKSWFMLIPLLFIINYLTSMFKGAFALPTKSYYQNFYDYASERKLWPEYASFFDGRILNSYAIAKFIDQNSKPVDSIFVWGDAASVYVLSNRQPATRFIQAHHLTTIDSKNYELIIEKLHVQKPKFIIIDRPVHFAFPLLEEYVKSYYEQAAVFRDLYVYIIAF